ncbi:MAG: TerB family tellurite resistance protein [Pseudomonadota bacterium]
MFEYIKNAILKKTKIDVDELEIERKTAVVALMLEIANADDEFTSVEKETLIDIIKQEFLLDQISVIKLIKKAREEREKSIDLWFFTNAVNKQFPKEEKIKILKMLWNIIYADHVVTPEEEYIIRKIANLLRIEHHEFIKTKLDAKI